MRWEWDDRERGELQAAYRAHLREMTAARQAAERRRAADQDFKREIARVEEEHRAWLRAHLPAEALPGDRHEPRSRRVGPLG
jgi:hypothetical protein